MDTAVSPQGFSCASRTARRVMPGTVAGRPGLRRLLVSYLFAASLRCQASSVAGVTGKMPVQCLRGKSRASGEPHPVGRLVPHPAGIAAQHRVLVPQDEQLSILRQVASGPVRLLAAAGPPLCGARGAGWAGGCAPGDVGVHGQAAGGAGGCRPRACQDVGADDLRRGGAGAGGVPGAEPQRASARVNDRAVESAFVFDRHAAANLTGGLRHLGATAAGPYPGRPGRKAAP
jgi:hypothetical protein